jgi:hypothetical protein
LRQFFEEDHDEEDEDEDDDEATWRRPKRPRHAAKISNPPMHRWGATETSMEGVLSNWDALGRAFREAGRASQWDGMEDIKTVLEEFHSVLRPFRHVQVVAQSGAKFKLLDAILKLMKAWQAISRGVGNKVTMIWPLPSVNDILRKTPPVRKGNDELDPRTRLVIQKMRAALDFRYFFRYHPIKALKTVSSLPRLTESNVELDSFNASYLFELALLLHPELYKGSFIEDNCMAIDISDSDLTDTVRRAAPTLHDLRLRHAALVKAACWKKIRELAIVAGRSTPMVTNRITQSLSQSSTLSFLPSQDTLIASPPRKKSKSLAGAMYGSPESDTMGTPASPAAAVRSVPEQVDDEMQRYKTLSRWWPYSKQDREIVGINAIEWWLKYAEDERINLPCLTKVALAIFGVLPGSGALECDIGGFKDILGPKRSRMDPAAVEMHLVVDKNKDLTELDPGKLERIPQSNWDRLYPRRPVSPVDYHEDEELEPLEDLDHDGDLGLSYSFDPNPAL